MFKWFRRWRHRRAVRRFAKCLRPYLNPPDREWFSLELDEEKRDG